MHRRWLLVAFITCLPFGGTLALRGQSPGLSVEEQLRSQYRVASLDASNRVVRAGTVLSVALDGLRADPPSQYGCWYNSHKPGNGIKYSALTEALTPVDLRNQVRPLQVGEKVVVLRIDVKPSDVGLCVQTYSDNPDDPPFRASVLFQFPQKNFVLPSNLKAIQDSIAEVFTIDASTPTEPPVPAPQLEQAAGRYVMTQAPGNHIDLKADGTLSLLQGGRNYSGTFTLDGNKVMGRIGKGPPRQEGFLQGDTLIDPSGSTWVKQTTTQTAAKPTIAPPIAPPIAPAIAPLRLPSTYTNAQSPADQLQFNADNTFSLQEAGQPYHGTFVANGSSVELNISGGPTTTATIQGNNLTDGSGQTWVLREQSPGAAPSGPLLQNDDIIKMVKAGLDDAIIIAKIGGSKCQFDTSTDALIQLKTSGASAAVLKAIISAGK
jgi:hypothetical protein